MDNWKGDKWIDGMQINENMTNTFMIHWFVENEKLINGHGEKTLGDKHENDIKTNAKVTCIQMITWYCDKC